MKVFGVGDTADAPHQWFWDGHEHVDPQKEAAAQSQRLASHTTTVATEYARQYVGPMVLRPDGEVERNETALAEAEAEAALGAEKEPLHAGRVKRSLAGVGLEPTTSGL